MAFHNDYIDLGWPVIPVWWTEGGVCRCRRRVHCQSPGKHPIAELVPNGITDATLNHDVANEWWNAYPKAGIAIATGESVWVLDTDVGHGGEISLIDLQETYGDLGASVSAKTGGGGRHFYFKGDKRVRNSASKIAPGIDVRGVGGYVLVPPSGHASGRSYEWLDEPDGEIAPAPEWLLDMVTVSRGGDKQPLELKEHIYSGERNAYLMQYAGKLRRAGFDGGQIFQHLQWLNGRCVSENGDSKPLPEGELKRIAESAARYEVEMADATDIEFALVGCLWASPKYRYLLGKVDPRAFRNEECRHWWETMIAIMPNSPDHALMGIGQDQYNEIISEVPNLDSAPRYAEQIRAPHVRKRMQLKTERLLTAIRDERSEDELVVLASQIVERSGGVVLQGGRVTDDDFTRDSVKGIPTGTPIDGHTVCRGLAKEQTTVIAGLTGRGKTPLAVQCTISALATGASVLYWTFSDFNAAQLLQQRFMPQLCGFRERPSDPVEYESWQKAAQWLKDRPLYRYDDPVTIEEVRREAKAIAESRGLDMIVLDYAQAIPSDSVKGVYETVQEVARQTAIIARECDAAVLLLSQVTQEMGGHHKARYGAELEQNAAFVLQMGDRIVGDNVYEEVFEMKVTKNRFGPAGMTFKARFRHELLRFDFN